MTTMNPHINNGTTSSGNSIDSRNINTPVINWAMNRCEESGGRRRRRRRRSTAAVGLKAGSSTLVNINIPPSTTGLRVNATPPSHNEGLAMSEFNLTSPGSVPLVIRVTPVKPVSMRVFIRRDEPPTVSQYDWMLTSWASDDNYTLYVASELTQDSSIVYVAVQSSAGTYTLYTVAPRELRGCKNGPAPFPDRMSYKATKPGLVSVLYLSMFFYCVGVY